jgi:hypothetical protein
MLSPNMLACSMIDRTSKSSLHPIKGQRQGVEISSLNSHILEETYEDKKSQIVLVEKAEDLFASVKHQLSYTMQQTEHTVSLAVV